MIKTLLQLKKIRLDQAQPLTERVVKVNRVAKVIAGGRNLSFNALVVVGDGHGCVGSGLGKAKNVPDAIKKGTAIARRNLIKVSLRFSSIPHEVRYRYSASLVILRPAAPGTGVIAGASVRAVVELVGVTDILSKVMGSTTPCNVVKATLGALAELETQEEVQLRRMINSAKSDDIVEQDGEKAGS